MPFRLRVRYKELVLIERRLAAQVMASENTPLTVRAITTGMLLGAVLSFTNVYTGLRTGWFFSVCLSACVLSQGAFKIARTLRLVKTSLSMSETSYMQSTASSSGYATGNMLAGAVPALLLLSVSEAAPTGVQQKWYVLVLWVFALALLGVVLAIPFRRRFIEELELPFPSGVAAAVTIRSFHEGAPSQTWASASLSVGALFGSALAFLRDLQPAWVSSRSKVFDFLPAISVRGAFYKASDFLLTFEHSALFWAAGAIVGIRTTGWMTLAALAQVFVLAPFALEASWVKDGVHVMAASAPSAVWKDVGIWFGAALLIAHGLTQLFLGLWASKAKHGHFESHVVPRRLFWVVVVVTGVLIVLLGRFFFEIPLVLGALAIALSFVFGVVAARATGETDITPGAALAKVTQLVFGIFLSGNIVANVMSASMTHATATAGADLLNDLKCGHLLRVNPRNQILAQALGTMIGAVASVSCYFLLVPDASVLLGQNGESPLFAAPGAHQIKAVAQLMVHGLGHLHPMVRGLLVCGLLFGIAIALTETFWVTKSSKALPSAAGIALGFALPASISITMFFGAALAFFATRRRSEVYSQRVLPLASGALVGESLASLGVALWGVFSR